MHFAYEWNSNLLIDGEIKDTWKTGQPKFASFELGQKVVQKVIKVGNKLSDKLSPKFDGL